MRIKDLEEKTTLGNGDWMAVDSETGTRKISPETLQKNANITELFDAVNAIPSEADLDTYKIPGRYTCANATVAKTILHNPNTNAGFSLEVEKVGSLGRIYQTLKTAISGPFVYQRVYAENGWGEWMNISGQMSTTEKFVGSLDGANVYSKIIETPMTGFASSSDWTTVAVPLGVTPVRIISMDFVISNGTQAYMLPYIGWNGEIQTFFWNIEGSEAKFRNKANWGSGYTLRAKIYYTK